MNAPGDGARRAQTAHSLGFLIQVIAANAVPLLGLWWFGWGTTTTLALYWCENVLGSAFVALRLALHERLTHDPGYGHNQLGVSTGSGDGQRKIGRFLPEFLTGAFVFTAAHAIFLAALVLKFLPEAGGTPLDALALRRGLLALAVVLTLSFLLDVRRLRALPFPLMVRMAQRAMSRVLVVHLAIIFGFAALAVTHRASTFLMVFGGLKLIADIASSWPARDQKPAGEAAAQDSNANARGLRRTAARPGVSKDRA